MTEQRLYISTIKAREAVQDNFELECLAFCVMGKLLFGCSVMQKTTARRYKYMFRMGYERFTRLLSGCISRGLVIEYGSFYRFAAVKDFNAMNMRIELPKAWGKSLKKRSAIKITQVKDYIRKVVQYDLFEKKASIDNALKSQNNPRNLRAYKKSQRLLARISHNSTLTGNFRGTSVARVAANMHTDAQKARKLLREMEASGWLSHRAVIFDTGYNASQFTPYTLQLVKEFGWKGSYFRVGEKIYCQAANVYALEGESMLTCRKSK